MTKISEAAKRNARELLTAEYDIRPFNDWPYTDEEIAERVLARVLQERSDVAKELQSWPAYGDAWRERLQALILPDEPDPVDTLLSCYFSDAAAKSFKANLVKRGLEIVEVKR